MKKFAVPALTLIVLALTLCTFFCVPASDGTAYAAENEYYICVSPSDGTLVANGTAQASDIAVYGGADEVVFYLTQSYYYKAVRYGSIYILDSSVGSGYYIEGPLPENVLYTSLPEGATTANAIPTVTLTIAEGASVTLANLVTVDSSDTSYTLKFLGFAGYSETDGARTVAFSADNGISPVTYGTAKESAFNEFSVAWHPVAEARRETLLAPEDTDDDDVDLTAGTSSDALRIILIIGIAVPALLIVFLLFKPSSDKKRSYDKRAMRGDTRRGIDYDRERSYDADRERYERGYRDYERREYPTDRRDYDYDGRDDDRRY